MVGVGAGLVFTPCQESEGPLRAWLRLVGGFSPREVVTSWIFLLTALSMGHSDWPHTSSPRTGMKRKERAFILQVLQEKNQETPQLGLPLPILGKLRPTEHMGLGAVGPN